VDKKLAIRKGHSSFVGVSLKKNVSICGIQETFMATHVSPT
jgi:hypothetical protein